MGKSEGSSSPMTSRSQSPTVSPLCSPRAASNIPSSSLVKKITNAFMPICEKSKNSVVDTEANSAALRVLFKSVLQSDDFDYKKNAIELLYRLLNNKKKNIQLAVQSGIIPFLISFLKNGILSDDAGHFFQDKVVCLLAAIIKEDSKYCDLAERFGMIRLLYVFLREIILEKENEYYATSSYFASSILKVFQYLFVSEMEMEFSKKQDLLAFLSNALKSFATNSNYQSDSTDLSDGDSTDSVESHVRFKKRRRKNIQIDMSLDIVHVLSAATEEKIDDVMFIYSNQNCIIENLLQNNYQTESICPVLRLLGNGIRLSDDVIKSAMEETTFLEKLMLYLEHNPCKSNHREIVWILSNISCTREVSYFHSMIDVGIFEKLNELIKIDSSISVNDDMLELIQNVFFFGDLRCKTYLLQLGIENVLCLMMNLQQSIGKVLELFNSIIAFVLEIKIYDKFRFQVNKFMNREILEEWSFSKDFEVQSKASYILSTLENSSRHLPTPPSPEEEIVS